MGLPSKAHRELDLFSLMEKAGRWGRGVKSTRKIAKTNGVTLQDQWEDSTPIASKWNNQINHGYHQ